MAHAENTTDDHHGAAHSDGHYIKIWALLLVLLVISIAGPEFSHLFPDQMAKAVVLITAFGIAVVKAFFVVVHFMHLDVERPVVRYILITCLVFVGLFFAGVSPDVLRHTGRNWSNLAAAEAIARAEKEQAAQAELGEHGAIAGEEGRHEDEHVSDIQQHTQNPPEPNFAELTEPDAKVQWLMTLGTSIYTQGVAEAPGSACVTCHGQEGAGLPGLTEAFAGASSLETCKETKRVTREGLVAEVVVDGVTHKRVMPGFSGLTEIQLAAVATYLRREFAKKQDICEPAR